MQIKASITIMGCGNSAGTPAIGNHWGVCDPAEPRNRRTRPSILIRSAETNVLVDTGPDFREQANRENLTHVDHVIYTHTHSDHIMGIDELRTLNLRHKAITPVYGTAETIDEIESRFSYLFTERFKVYPRILESNIIPDSALNREVMFGDIPVIPFLQDHGTCSSLGLRVGDVGYSTDMVDLPPESIETLKGVRTWIVDGAGYRMEKNIVHATLESVFAFNERIGAERIVITHMTPGMDYKTLVSELPDGCEPAWDGMEIPVLIRQPQPF